jgi:hypothetical protein
MGRAPHVLAAAASDNRKPRPMDEVHDDIVELLSLPTRGMGAPSLAQIEDTLTEGYAQALALEAERLRLERQLGQVARDGERPDLASELAEITDRISRADGRLRHLRTLLGSLRERAREARTA